MTGRITIRRTVPHSVSGLIAGGALLAVMTALTGQASAAPITYTQTVTGSGALGASNFTNAIITLTEFADTSNVVNVVITGNNTAAVTPSTITVTVAGVGTATITSAMFTVDNQTDGAAGLRTGTIGGASAGYFLVPNAFFNSYNLKSSTDLLSGTLTFSSTTLTTSAGNFHITSVSTPGTFQASVAPEPGSLTLAACTALPLVGMLARKRRRKA